MANFGIGIDENVSSADEVAHAIEIQEEQEKSAAKKNNKKSETQKTDKNPDPKPQSPADEKAVDELSNDVTKMLIDEIVEKAARTGTDIRAICQCANKPDLKEFTAADCQTILKVLNKKLRKLETAQK